MTVYDAIGEGYAANRRPDSRWAAAILGALGTAQSIVNVGAGAGSYEPHDRVVVAVEPSRRMTAQRTPGSAPVVQGVGESLPFRANAFDAAVAILTVHHWPDAARGLGELQRVAPVQVIVTWEPQVFAGRFWLVRDYLPLDAPRESVAGHWIADRLTDVQTIPLPVPHDCTDGVFGAYWRRPEKYLDPTVRASISGLALADQSQVASAMARLESDLRDGTWQARNDGLLTLDEIDLGYQILVGRSVPGGE